ncbi:MAG: phosphotransferase enzyme family protein [Microthrixaceae bacterium]
MSDSNAIPTVEAVRSRCATGWGLSSPRVRPLPGPGLCSETWLVSQGEDHWVAKAIPGDAAHRTLRFELGLRVAEELGHAGFRVGLPLRTTHGDIIDDIDGWKVALLEFEDGQPFDVTDHETAFETGKLIGRLHQGMQHLGVSAPAWTPEEDFLDAPCYSLRPGLADLAAEVIDAARLAASDLQVGWIHGDLNVDEILVAPSGTIAVVDWGAIHAAPQLLDLITFCDEDCFPALLSGYLESRPEAGTEQRALPALERLHWLRQTAFWGGRMLQPFRDAATKQGFTNDYAFERSYEVLLTGRWRP